MGFPFAAEFYTIIEFSSKEDFFKAYEKFKTGHDTDENFSISKISIPPTIGWAKSPLRSSVINVLFF